MASQTTFTDDHEAELWRSVAAGMIVTLSVAPSSPGPLDIAAHAGLFADAAVLEYRKRCGQATFEKGFDRGWRRAELAIANLLESDAAANTRLSDIAQRLRDSSWENWREEEKRTSTLATTAEVECTQCGYSTVIPAGDAEATCRYCDGLVKR